MRYFEFVAYTEFLGTSYSKVIATFYFKVIALEDNEVENFSFDEYIEDMARDNVESFSHLVTGYGEDWKSIREKENFYKNTQTCSYYNEIIEARYLELLEGLK